MKFASPEFLFALFAIAIPIIIHLFNFRKFKKIYFSNVEFLKDVQQETQSKSKLKHLLILASRILAISFLVFAFAQPFIPASENHKSNQNNVVGIYLDNSFSMEGTNENGPLLDDAKKKAIQLVQAHRNTDKFLLTTNNFSTGDQHELSQEEVIDKIETVTISTATRTLSAVYSRVKDALMSSEIENKSLYLFSDFQASTANLKEVNPDTIINAHLAPVINSKISNLYIDSCWFSSPTHLLGQNENLKVRIKNNGNNDLENLPLKLYINNQNVVPASFSVKANSEVLLELNYTNKTEGIQQGKIELRDAPVIMDDNFYFAYHISDNINILSINEQEPSAALDAIYTTDSVFNYSSQNIKQLDYSQIKRSNLIILQELKEINSGLANTLKKYLDQGGNIVVIPPTEELSFESYQEFLSLLSVNYYTVSDTSKNKVGELNLKHPIYQDVFETQPDKNINLPVVAQHYHLSKNMTSYNNKLLTLRNGIPFLAEYKVGKGSIYLATSSLAKEANNFANHAIFVPTFYKIALLSQTSYPLFHTIGTSTTLELPRTENDQVYHIKNEQLDVIPQVRTSSNYTTVFLNTGIKDAGNYSLENNLNKIGLAYNYNRLESDLTSIAPSQLQEMIDKLGLHMKLLDTQSTNIQNALTELNIGKKYWKYCIILALLFLAAEIALIKFFN